MPSWRILSVFDAQTGEEEDQSQSVKPQATPLLVVSLGFWAGAAGAFLLSKDLPFVFGVGISAASLMAGLMGTAGLWRCRNQTLCLTVLGLGLGCACGCVAGIDLHAQQDSISSEGSGGLRLFSVVEDVRYGEFGDSCIAETELPGGTTVRVRLVLRCEDAGLKCGDIIESYATLQAPSEFSQDYYWSQGLAASASLYSIEHIERNDFLSPLYGLRKAGLSVFEGYDGQGAALLKAIVFGDRTGLSDSALYPAVKATGLAHLVAVSGSHLSIVVAFMAFCLVPLRLPRIGAIALQIGCILAYVICTGLPVSAIRAACMALVSMSAFFATRRSSSQSSLGACILGILLIDPATAVSVSFALSALSTLGIVVLGRLFTVWSMHFRLTRPALVREGLSMTLASSVLALPLSSAVFAQLSLISPLANILAGPLFAVLCAGGLAVSLLVLAVPCLSGVLVTPLVLFSEGFCEAVQALSHVPCAAIPWDGDVMSSLAFSAVLLLVLWRLWPAPSKLKLCVSGMAVLLVLSCCFLGGFPASDDEIIMLDVAQGDAFLIKSKGAAVLIDTGTADTLLLQGLARHGVLSLDAVVITHADDDHCGSLSALEGIVAIKTVCFAADVDRCGCGSCTDLAHTARDLVGQTGVVRLEKGDMLRVGNFELDVLWPGSFTDKGGNADSLVMLARLAKGNGADSWKALFCGDAESEQLEAIMRESQVEGIDLLKVGHHGSKVALTSDIMVQLRPKAALISVGARNRYGHPSPEVMALLDGVSCEVFRTDEEGDVVCKLEPEKLRIETLR